MDMLDQKKLYRSLYNPPANDVTSVTVPPMKFLAIDGIGAPESSVFQNAMQALYSLSYTIKFWPKKHPSPPGYVAYTVSPLEGLWSVKGSDGRNFAQIPRDQWVWTLLIRQPDFVTDDLVASAKVEVATKKPEIDTSVVILQTFNEGESVQIMHVGPYADERSTILKLDTYMSEHGLVSNGRHHEIYLGDPRRAKPESLKTILRHPVRRQIV